MGTVEKICVGLIVAVCLGCESGEASSLEKQAVGTGVRVLVVGIDGATLEVLVPEMKAERLPNFKRLIEMGAHGQLQSEKPLISPAIWTTIATGKERKAHGIRNFLVKKKSEPESERLVGSFDRRSLALWDIFSASGRTVGVMGWWATWPAEPISGWMVSDRMTRSRWSIWSEAGKESQLTHPESLAEELANLVADPAKFSKTEINKLVELNPAEWEEFRLAQAPIRRHGLSVFKFAYAAQRSYEEMALRQLKLKQPDLGLLLLIANDPISHTYWHYYEPKKFDGVDLEKASRLGKLIPNLYAHNDAYIGRLRHVIDEDTVIMVVSDHGFQASGKLPKVLSVDEHEEVFSDEERSAMAFDTVAIGATGKHHEMGLFIASGGPILKKANVQASIYDIAPTILALQGMPVPNDMPGRVLTEIIDPEFLARYPITHIDSYSASIDREKTRVLGAETDTKTDEESMKMLRALGYIN
jgi:predicted AlkP superfamily phosphohydrolase/phosphomutase